jgi:hypothetical protein
MICGENCNSFKSLLKYETIIKELIQENEKLKKINEYFMIGMNRKDDYLLSLVKENTQLNSEMLTMHKLKDHQISNISNSYLNVTKTNTEAINRKSYLSSLQQNTNEKNTISQPDEKEGGKKVVKIKPLPISSNFNNFTNFNNTNSGGNSNLTPGHTKSKSQSTGNVFFKQQSQEEKNDLSKRDNKLPSAKNNFIRKMLTKKRKLNPLKDEVENYPQDDDMNPLTSPHRNLPLTKIMNNIVSSVFGRQNYKLSPFSKSGKPKITTHYDNILELFNNKSMKRPLREARSSFLSMSPEILKKIMEGDIIKEIQRLTNNDEEFINAMKTYPDEKLVLFCDLIGTLIKDYEYSINLIKRIKSFLTVSVRVVNTMILEDAISMMIKNTCEILECERTSIYVHDKFTNMLVIHSGENFKKGEWKVPCDKGIVGHVFMRGEKQKIDDAYLDERFNKDIDRKTNFRTKTILCVPLKDETGRSFGVIQSLNKKGGHLFSADDEELMEIFATQASSILKNSMRFDENLSYISRLKMLVDFSLRVQSITNMFEFTEMCESLLMKFWGTNEAQLLIYKGDILLHHQENNVIQEKQTNIGLIGKVYQKKELIHINSGYDNTDFNNLVDLESGYCLLTFPIFHYRREKEIIALGQFGYPHKLYGKNIRPKEIDIEVINFFCLITSMWLTNKL